MKNLCEEFKRFEGQPIEIFTDDERVTCGIDLESGDEAVRILDDCGRIHLVEFRHIASVVEPQMRLRRCCKEECECEEHHERHERHERRDRD